MKNLESGTSTLYQVASAAGVSPATVSRFLNGTAKVSDDKRRVIERVIDELNTSRTAWRRASRSVAPAPSAC